MHWLLYSSKTNEVSREIEKSFEKLAGPDYTCVGGGVEKLDDYLGRPHEIISHALLLVTDRDDLITLAKCREQIREWCTIIGMFGRGKDNMIRVALEFNPRFVAILPEEKHHLQLVVEKMIRNYRKRTPVPSRKEEGTDSRGKEREKN